MPDKRVHRGAHPEDAELFAPPAWPRLRQATAELSWLLTRGYSTVSALKLVGDRHRLNERQRIAVARCACSHRALLRRTSHRLDAELLRGQPLLLDGYNVLTSIEAALGGGVILAARDGCYRDMASMHGTYRKVVETQPALALLGEFANALGISALNWLLDSPVSNSGRLKQLLLEFARERQWAWSVELVPNPDETLAAANGPIATADSGILDRCAGWFNLVREVIDSRIDSAVVIDLSRDGDEIEPWTNADATL